MIQDTHYSIIRHIIAGFIALIITSLSACSIAPPVLFYSTAKELKLNRHVVKGGSFSMAYYSHQARAAIPDLHIYLGGDGVPWIDNWIRSKDPTPRNPMVLHLMNQDRHPSIFLGRPCYQGFYDSPACHPDMWTYGRYSEQIVAAMAEALINIINKYQVKRITLIGYSGGGALATLLAPRISQTTTVITIAGILDTDAWTRLHWYSRLKTSLNPATQAPIATHIKQFHLMGMNDTNIPPSISDKFISRQHAPVVMRYNNADHTCCWLKIWPDALKQIDNKTK